MGKCKEFFNREEKLPDSTEEFGIELEQYLHSIRCRYSLKFESPPGLPQEV